MRISDWSSDVCSSDLMTELYNYERFGLPTKAGSRYFYSRNDGLQPQSVLYVREGLKGEGRVLIDPNLWAKDGATALAEWSPSEDGKHLLYSVQDGGTDWRSDEHTSALQSLMRISQHVF